MVRSTRAGRYVRQPQGYQAFIPSPLPPDPPIDYDPRLISLLSRADQAVARLDGVANILPDPDLFVAMYVRREAVLSSQIEGTQSSLDDVLEFEAQPHTRRVPPDVTDIVNYVRAMNYGLERLQTLPLSGRLIREIHEQLLTGTRGENRQPGEFRTSQNWIGPPGASLASASFVPPPPSELQQALHNFERFLHNQSDMPILIHAALAHAQFETIHPFLDGNGRVGRLLITFLLCHRGLLQRPLLYLSHYLKLHRAEYYDRLTAIRESGDWEGWLRFFLQGVHETATQAARTARRIVELREHHRAQVASTTSGHGAALLDLLYRFPVMSVPQVAEQLELAYSTANTLVSRFEELSILNEITGRSRDRLYRYDAYVDLFEEDLELPPDPRFETTESNLE